MEVRMSAYEFWDELGNIFNAIVAYQDKTIEFNKRFVNPWIRLGTVFDQNDNNAEALVAHKKVIEIDKDNAANWLSLGDVYFKIGSFEEASASYSKAIELNPKLGWAYANLALTNATRQKYNEAINMYVKSLELITDEKDRAMIWNRLGNVYRKVNDYENAFIAFQMADECDGQNAGFEDRLDDVKVEQKVMPIVAEVYVNNHTPPVVEEALAEAPEAARPSEVAVTNAPLAEAAAESLEQEETCVQEEHISEHIETEVPAVLDQMAEMSVQDESATNEATETPEVELATEQDLDVTAAVVTETSSVDEHEAELMELEKFIQTMAPEQLSQEPTSSEATAEVDPITVDAEIEQPALEENTVNDSPAEVIAEAPVIETAKDEAIASESSPFEEPVIEEKHLEVDSKAIDPEIATDKHQSEIIVEANAEEKGAEEVQPEAVAEVPAEEIQITEENPAPEFAVADVSTNTTMTPVMTHEAGTFADPSALNQPVVLVIDDLNELIDQVAPLDEADSDTKPIETEAQPEVQVEASELIENAMVSETLPEHDGVDDEAAEAVAEVSEAQLDGVDTETPVADEIQSEPSVATEEVSLKNDQPEAISEAMAEERVQSAYDEFLKNAAGPIVVFDEKPAEVTAHEANLTSPNFNRNLKVEPDTKNAHVWNELGNVYFNTGAYDEAISAYGKAIELDDWFAWPYSNLALVYVQKEKYAEAVLLYQRSIELFASDKDKATTWNRLGNVYRRLNDYDNAIACYQRADELDPNNATLSLRLRFSLLGSLNMEPSPSLAI
jgi:tetratricopeptide (TPR) repeat protein